MEVRKTKFWRITRQECCREISESLKILKHRYETALVIIFRNLCIFLPGIFTCKPTRLIFFFFFFPSPPYRRCHYENTGIDATLPALWYSYSLNCRSIVLFGFYFLDFLKNQTKLRLISISRIIRIRNIRLIFLFLLLISRTSSCVTIFRFFSIRRRSVFEFREEDFFRPPPPHRSPFNPAISNNLHILSSENQREKEREATCEQREGEEGEGKG